MKMLLPLWSLAWLSVATLHGQDVPPAFEKNDSEEVEAPGEDMLDPFDPAVSAPKMIRVQVEFIEVAHKDLTRLMMGENSGAADATAMRIKLQTMVDEEKAKILDTQIMTARSGQKSTSESFQEFIYPTEYEPMTCLPREKAQVPKDISMGSMGNPATPTAFETKNVGSMLEIEPILGENDKLIDLRFLPELIWYTGDKVWQERKDELGNITKVTQPNFYKLGINTSITCIDGQYNMVGVVSPKNEAGETDLERKAMIFVKCNVLSVIP